MKSVDVITEITIAAPLDKVAKFASDPDNATQWYDNIKSVWWKTEKPLTKGSQVTFTAEFIGRILEYTYQVTEFVPEERLVMQTAEGPFPMKTTYIWKKDSKGHTHMTLRNTGQVSGFSKLFTPIMARMMKKANTKDLAKLKQILERK